MQLEFIYPDWPAPENIRAVTTTRVGGVSRAPYDSLNLAVHVGDVQAAVAANRRRLQNALGLPAEPVWLSQVHGAEVIDAAAARPGAQADGGYTESPGVVCTVLTADCLPVFLCDRRGTRAAVLHAGWRGLMAGVIEAGIGKMRTNGQDLLAWLGPAIGPRAFEVGNEVREVFVRRDPGAEEAFRTLPDGRWQADLYALAGLRLRRLGVEAMYGGGHCTFQEEEKFFSYRRDGVCGRMASFIWMDG